MGWWVTCAFGGSGEESENSVCVTSMGHWSSIMWSSWERTDSDYFPQLYWGILHKSVHIYSVLHVTLIYMDTVKVINLFIKLPYVCVCLTGAMRMIKINFKVYDTGLVLTIVTRLYIRSPDLLWTFFTLRAMEHSRPYFWKKAAQELDNSLKSEIRDVRY